MTSGEAVGWRRCDRCRRPEQFPHRAPDGRIVCNICYYYKCLGSADVFWSRDKDYLFPYSIGRRGMRFTRPIKPMKAARVVEVVMANVSESEREHLALEEIRPRMCRQQGGPDGG